MKQNEKKKNTGAKSNPMKTEVSSTHIGIQPETVFGMVNKYGAYEIQPTADAANEFPEIAQGMPKQKPSRKKEDV